MIESESHWNPQGTRIYTEMLVELDDGRVETRVVPGGTVDGIRMVQFSLGGPVGYVAARTDGGAPLRWQNSCVYIRPDMAGSNDVAGSVEFDVLEQVLQTWEQGMASCSYLRFVREDPEMNEAGYDGKNIVKYQELVWDHPQTAAAAITTLFHVNRAGADDDGLIVDADIEINSVNFSSSVGGVTQGTKTPSDLANTMTHEVGHLMGLDHTCWQPESGLPQPTDGNGVLAPSCNCPGGGYACLPEDVREATMFNFQEPNETKKATLEPDDIAGVCSLYPIAEDPGECEPAGTGDEGGCGCVAAGRSVGGGGSIVLVIGLVFGLVRKRRRS